MYIDAASMASQMAIYDVSPAETRYNSRLKIFQNQSSMLSKITSSMSSLDSVIYKFTKPGASFVQNTTSLSSEDHVNVTTSGNASSVNMDLYVEQLASSHQVVVNTSAMNVNDEFSPATGSIEVQHGGETITIQLADAESNGDGTVSYQEFISHFNRVMDGRVTATMVRSGNEMKMLFTSNETGQDNQFQISASDDSGLSDAFSTANDNPIKTGTDAIVWLGDYGSGVQLTNSSNTFENIVNGVDVELKKAHEMGGIATNITVGPDADATMTLLKEFVTAYNDMMSVIAEATKSSGESSERGVFSTDSSFKSLEQQLKGLMRDSYNGVSLSEVGLSLDKSGKLELDEDKFREASKSVDMEQVFRAEGGLFTTLQKSVNDYTDFADGSLTRKKETIELQQKRINEALDKLEDKYQVIYSRYLAQYTRLNSIMASMDSINTLF
ncbi:flagellar filament capping protein FliD [Vibrio furnissii]|uniref:flagellar filament capping protein FliD n=1 Tax=Vibrio furnissii TaxID=29494 RepID=UPI0001B9189B|nr:flagellar filament capping protein FliD [Vibrio furnissii]EEX41976.1 flagellar hook-associated protein FliD [Vibrio furnissii CIP 102972]QDC92797.1 flagellar hook protein FliD [Vibrio furnissii]UON48573.1 flagellar filament capping protein FliD [Vibrio furnissii]SUP45122.1 Flagellar capping protein [Vibrio furnissii]